jgi:hypothetical protein
MYLIITIYKAEALDANNQSKESAELISKSLIKYPNSIPLKVYNYVNTKDEKNKARFNKESFDSLDGATIWNKINCLQLLLFHCIIRTNQLKKHYLCNGRYITDG